MAHTLKVNKYRLMELRDKAGIKTDAELADLLNVHPNTLYRIKHGAPPSPAFIAAMHHRLHAEFRDFLEVAEIAA
jgi:transcriptional regulator with XRE-family HTH domain